MKYIFPHSHFCGWRCITNVKPSDLSQPVEMGGEEGFLDLDAFVSEQLKLLGLEREAEIAEASAYLSFG